MSNSLYGGRHGHSFKIAKVFESVQEMTDAFQDPNYLEVTFEDFVLIDSINKHNPEHGNLFKRNIDINSDRKVESFNWNENTLKWDVLEIPAMGATYVGNVSGPQGSCSKIRFVDLPESLDSYFPSLDENDHPEYAKSEHNLSIQNGGLVSGKENHFINIRAVSSAGTESYPVTDIDLSIPYPVIEMTTSSDDIDDFRIDSLSDLKETPFYHSFDLVIPEKLTKKQIMVVSSDVVENSFNELVVGGILVPYYEMSGEG